MKNVRESQLKKCIFLTLEEFDETIKEIFGPEASTLYQYEGICIDSGNDDVEYDDDEIYARLSDYFDVNVTSFHSDNCEYVGVWVCYKERVMFTSVWDDGTIETTTCEIDKKSREVYNIQALESEPPTGSVVEEYITIEGKRYSVYNSEKVDIEDLDEDEFWYDGEEENVDNEENIKDAIFLTHCDNGVDITAPCKVNLATREVFDVQDYVITSTVGSIMEAVVIDGKTYNVYNAQEVETENLADGEYWYKN